MTDTLQIDDILPHFLYEDIKYISKYTELPLKKIILVSSVWGLYRYKIPITMKIDRFIIKDSNGTDESESVNNYWKELKVKIEQDYDLIKNLKKIERKFNNSYPLKESETPNDRYILFMKFLEDIRIGKSSLSTQIKKVAVVRKVTHLKVKNTPQIEDFPIFDEKSTIKKLLDVLLKSGIFLIFFISPTPLILFISIEFFKYNYPAILRYQPEMFFGLVFVLIFASIISGWVSLTFIRYYQNTAKERKLKKEIRKKYKFKRLKFRKIKKEFKNKTPYSKFKGTQAQWYQQLETFLESKNKEIKSKGKP